MKRPPQRKEAFEPIGIVISSGWRQAEEVPTCAAYIYGDAPDAAPLAAKAELEAAIK